MAAPLSGIEVLSLVAGLGSGIISAMATLTKLGAGNFATPMGESVGGIGSIINGTPLTPFTGARNTAKPMADIFSTPAKMMGDISIQTSKLLSPIKSMNDAFANTLSSILTSFTPQIANLTPQNPLPTSKNGF